MQDEHAFEHSHPNTSHSRLSLFHSQDSIVNDSARQHNMSIDKPDPIETNTNGGGISQILEKSDENSNSNEDSKDDSKQRSNSSN